MVIRLDEIIWEEIVDRKQLQWSGGTAVTIQ